MTLMEKECRNSYLQYVIDRLTAEFHNSRQIYGRLCFANKNGVIFHVEAFPNEYALITEYAHSYRDASNNIFEDGDRHYIDEYGGMEEMYLDMLEEIQSSELYDE